MSMPTLGSTPETAILLNEHDSLRTVGGGDLSLLAPSSGLFLLAAIGEIGGGWLVWNHVRCGKPWYWAVFGGAALVTYGFIPTLQPFSANEFGRLDAAYGGLFIVMSFAWGRIFDGLLLDTGDVLGSLLCLAGAFTILAWPR